MGSEVFRFMTVRPPQRVNHQELEQYVVRVDDFAEPVTEVDDFAAPVPENDDPSSFYVCSKLYSDLRKHHRAGDRLGMVEVAKQFLGISSSNLARLDRLTSKSLRDPPSIVDLDRWIGSQRKSIMLGDLRQAAQNIFGVSPAEIISTDEYQTVRRDISCFLIVLSIYPHGFLHLRLPLMRFMRIMGLLERMAEPNDNTLETEGGIGKALRAHVLLPCDIFPLPSAQSSAQALGQSRQEEDNKLELETFKSYICDRCLKMMITFGDRFWREILWKLKDEDIHF